MALIVEVKVNTEKIFTLVAENIYGKKKGLNPYRLKLYNGNSELIKESLTSHVYEEGAIKLVQRMASELYQYGTIPAPKKNIRA